MILPLSVSSMMMALTDCRKSGCSVVSCEFTVSPHPPVCTGAGPVTEIDVQPFGRLRTGMDRIDSMFLYVASMIRTDVWVVKGEGTKCRVFRLLGISHNRSW